MPFGERNDPGGSQLVSGHGQSGASDFGGNAESPVGGDDGPADLQGVGVPWRVAEQAINLHRGWCVGGHA